MPKGITVDINDLIYEVARIVEKSTRFESNIMDMDRKVKRLQEVNNALVRENAELKAQLVAPEVDEDAE